jgi:hypothetical protein
MKRLDKPTKYRRGYLLNIKKKTAVPFNFLSNGKLSEYLVGRALIFWSRVFNINMLKSLTNQLFHIHLNTQITMVKGEVT